MILYWVSIVAAVLGLADSLYLSWIKLTNSVAACSTIGDCDVVNNSQYSEIAGFPIALLGAGAYVLLIMLLYVEKRFPHIRETVQMGAFGLTLTGTLYSGYLTYLEIAVIRAICPFCVVSAILMAALFAISTVRLLTNGETSRGG
jgi:uncharacterized membrane protein